MIFQYCLNDTMTLSQCLHDLSSFSSSLSGFMSLPLKFLWVVKYMFILLLLFQIYFSLHDEFYFYEADTVKNPRSKHVTQDNATIPVHDHAIRTREFSINYCICLWENKNEKHVDVNVNVCSALRGVKKESRRCLIRLNYLFLHMTLHG